LCVFVCVWGVGLGGIVRKVSVQWAVTHCGNMGHQSSG